MLNDLLDRLIRPMLSRPVTSTYPSTPIDLPASVRGLPVVDADRCDEDAACVTACPTGAISISHDPTEGVWTIDAGRCIFCRACELACPRDAISMSGGVELSRSRRQALTQRTGVTRP